MKKMNLVKVVQLIIFVLLALASIALVLLDPGTRLYVAKNRHILVVCLLLWVTLIASFVFLYLDFHLFTIFRKNVKELNQAVHADTITGIPNRFSCDSLIEKYIGSPLPAHIGCVMIDITNIIHINQFYGREAGDEAIRQFSDMLHLVAAGQCFIGRNGGNKFIALYEDCTREKLDDLLERLHAQVHAANKQIHTPPIRYKYGIAYHDEQDDTKNYSITDLIAEANNLIYVDKD